MSLVEVKTADLIGPALDWAVAHATKAWEWAHEWFPTMTLDPAFAGVEAFEFNGGREACRLTPCNPFRQDYGIFNPSTNWAQGGRLIGVHNVEFSIDDDTCEVGASLLAWRSFGKSHRTRWSRGATHLIAACRAIVAAKLGDLVMVPAELMP